MLGTGAPVSLVVFDLDGTLVDSKQDLADAVNRLLASCGAPPLPEARIARMVGDGAATLVARAFATSGIDPPGDALPRFLSFYDECLLDHTRPYAGIEMVLEQLSRRLPLAVLTNKPDRATRRVLDGLGLSPFFAPERVIGGDGPFPRKPDPTALRALASRVGAETVRTVLVGDSAVDWRTARAAGAIACVASYGFGFETFPADELEAGTWVISTLNELVTVL